jgi:Ca2+-binding EF-hand superfamily protein
MAALAAQQNIRRVEEDVRTRVQTRRVRVDEFFQDFDRLRSGFVTAGQFKRVLDEQLGLSLTEEQVNSIVKAYDSKGDGRVNYRAFASQINQARQTKICST